MTARTTGWSLGWAAASLAGLGVLLLLSPGVGTESGQFGLRDAWRGRLGIAIPAGELERRGIADLDGDGSVSEAEARDFAVAARRIGFGLRFPRSMLALQVGVTLALCGAALQVLLRNSLAEPYTLGIASGGALGALVVMRAGWSAMLLGISTVSVGAFCGAMIVVGLVVVVARGSRRLSANELLLAGVTLGMFCSALMMFVTALSDERMTFQMIRWLMGSLDPLSSVQNVHLLPLIVPSWVVLVLSARALNQYRLGDELAATRGINVRGLQITCLLVTALATAGVVARCGPIGFVGLVVPHIVGLVVGSDCRVLLPMSAVTGGAFLILCDWSAQWSMRFAGWATGRHLAGTTLPVGVMTAMLGVPLFVALLRARRR